MRDHLPRTVSKALGDTGLEPGALDIEITESAIVRDLEWTSTMLTEVRDMGIGIAIDDFGTGYNSLSYLKHFPVTALKIDRSFVGEIGVDLFDEAISSAVAALGKALQIRVIAEGVETRKQFDSLRALGCDELQGFYFAPPLEAAHMATKLAISGAG
jgi:EAL domain-containing protein (putative c-di-GMP-specific phosphodiesterase class I)